MDGLHAVYGRWVLVASGSRAQEVRTHAYVVVEDGIISRVGTERPRGIPIYEIPDGFVLPGFVNCHNHCAASVLSRGLTEDHSSPHPAEQLVYRMLMPLGTLAVDTLSDREMRAVMELGMVEVLKGGSTTLVEIFRAGQRETFAAAAELGLRFYGALYVFSSAGLGFSEGRIRYETRGMETRGLDEALDAFRRFDGSEDGRIRVALAPHGTDTCGPELLHAVRRAANELGCLVTIHLAQSRQEVEAVEAAHGMRPAEYLDHCGLLGPDLIAAHCLYCSDEELDLLRRTDTTVASCPRTFSRVGLSAAYARFAARDIRTVIGTDGYNMDFITEMRAAGIVSKLHLRDGGAATAQDLVEAGTRRGAAALGRDDIGRIEPGARADLVVIDMSRPHLQPVSDPLRTLVWNVDRADVAATLVDGRYLVRDGALQTGDERDIVRRGAAAVEKLWTEARRQGLLDRHWRFA